MADAKIGFGQKIKIYREKRGWTQAKMANRLGISIGTLSGYEREYRQPSLTMLQQIANLLEVSPGDILNSDRGDKDLHGLADELNRKHSMGRQQWLAERNKRRNLGLIRKKSNG